MLINTQLYNYCPEVLDKAREDGHETVIHGRTNSEWQVRTIRPLPYTRI